MQKELPIKRIPVRIDKATVIFVPEGADIENHVKRYKEHEYTVDATCIGIEADGPSPGSIPGCWLI